MTHSDWAADKSLRRGTVCEVGKSQWMVRHSRVSAREELFPPLVLKGQSTREVAEAQSKVCGEGSGLWWRGSANPGDSTEREGLGEGMLCPFYTHLLPTCPHIGQTQCGSQRTREPVGVVHEDHPN